MIIDEDRVTVTDRPDGTALISLPSINYLDTQAYTAEIGLDRESAEQLRDALDGWLSQGDGVNVSTGCTASISSMCLQMTEGVTPCDDTCERRNR